VVLALGREARYGHIGGTAQKVLDRAACPVLAVPVLEGAPVEEPPRRILLPLDGSVRSLHVLPTVQHLARALEAHVVIATLIDSPVRTELLSRDEDFGLASELSQRLALRAEAYVTRIRSRLEANGIAASTRVQKVNDARSGLVDLARTEGISLTIMSAHGSGCNPRKRFGTVPSHFMAHSHSPLLMLQDLPQLPERLSRRPTSRMPFRSLDVVVGGG
jgi:nucleotide-binding universal stress UspA family protein